MFVQRCWLPAALLMLCLLPACTSSPRPEGSAASPPIATGLRLPDPSSLALARGASDGATGQTLTGAEYDPALPACNVAADGSACAFDAQWDSIAPDNADLAYGVYPFTIEGYTGPAELHLAWQEPPAAGELWVALADFPADRWRWFQPADASLLEYNANAPYFDGEGRCFAAVLLAGDTPLTLNWIRVGVEAANQPPVADLTADVTAGLAPLTVQFDASASYDPDGEITLFEWDWDGDGSYEEDTGITPTASHEFSAAGQCQVAVQVTDDGALTATDGLTVSVGDEPGWSAAAAVPGDIQHAVPLWNVNGNPAVFYPNGNNLAYRRATDCLGTSWGDEVVIDASEEMLHRFNAALVSGRPAVAYHRDTQVGPGEHFELRYCAAEDDVGLSWNAPLTLSAESQYTDSYEVPCVAEIDGRPAVLYAVEVVGARQAYFVRATDDYGASWGTPVSVGGPGLSFLSNLAVIDGEPACFVARTLTEPDDMQLYYVTGNDAAGSSFGTEQMMKSLGFQSMFMGKLAEVDGKPAVAYLLGADIYFLRATDAAGTAWGDTQTVATSSGMAIGIDLAVILGRPAVAYFVWWYCTSGEIWYVSAQDGTGVAWNAAELITDREFDMAYPPYHPPRIGHAAGLAAACTGGPGDPVKISVRY